MLSTNKTRGEIFFEKGEIVHARWKSHDGKRAFHELMNLTSGKYFFDNHLPNVRQTISEPLSLLLLSMRPADEPHPHGPEKTGAHEKLFTTISS